MNSFSETHEEVPVFESEVISDKKPTEMSPESYSDVETSESHHDVRETKDPQEILINGIQDITNTLSLLEDFELNDVLTIILETMYRSFSFNRVLFCIMNMKAGEMRANFGFEKDIDNIIKDFRFAVIKNPDVFNFAFLQAKDVGIDDASDVHFRKRIPEWYVQAVSAPALVLYPLRVNKRVVGLFYADRDFKGKVISGSQVNYMKTLCNQAVLAIKQIR